MNLHTDGQFPILSGGLFALPALFLLGFEGLGLLLELLAERDAICGRRVEGRCDGGETTVVWTNQQWTMNGPTEYAASAAGKPWPEHGELW